MKGDKGITDGPTVWPIILVLGIIFIAGLITVWHGHWLIGGIGIALAISYLGFGLKYVAVSLGWGMYGWDREDFRLALFAPLALIVDWFYTPVGKKTDSR